MTATQTLLGAAALLAAGPSLAQETVKSGGGLPIDLLEWFAGLATVLIAILALAYALRKLGRFSRIDQGSFRVLAAVSVGTRERVVLVQVGEKQLVLGVAPGRVQNLCVLSGEETLKPAEQSDAPGFAERLASLQMGRPK
ncbi:flagellar biosynthetic protein FliO [Methylococcus sp. EFPC2]|uniref:flagellar biosynthetic protein FliO n=1 Tax=Methylococcus sp. EFPC2 TaxID=2812648 RepID=UPI001967AF24|nr:flagellar biosynthetic protein FliO [Methylococcus sp. EFPC2]QSA97640.1 flagellar biosynthetic protein FliO [Methylococcus sp. EFPC2]